MAWERIWNGAMFVPANAATLPVIGDVLSDGSTPFTGPQQGIAATAANELTTLGQFDWPIDELAFSQALPVRRVWTAIAADYTAPADETVLVSIHGTDANNNRHVHIRAFLNGGLVFGATQRSTNAIEPHSTPATPLELTAGDVLTFQVATNNNGSTITGTRRVARINGV